MKVTFSSNENGGSVRSINPVPGTTLGQVLNTFGTYPRENFLITIRRNGQVAEYGDDEVLRDEDRISVTPKKQDGAV